MLFPPRWTGAAGPGTWLRYRRCLLLCRSPTLSLPSLHPDGPAQSSRFVFRVAARVLEALEINNGRKIITFKVILLGDGGVGKSSLMNRYVTNKFDTQLFHTIGVEFLNKDLEVDGHFVTMQIWDTAGQERFRSLRTPFYRGSDCCLLTFSVDDSQSFQNLSNWKKEFIYYADVKEPESFPFVILGNKIDISERQVSTEEAQAWCRDNGDYPYFETSAKDATNVAAAFEEAVRRVLATEDRSDHLIQTDTVNLHRKPKPSSSCC
ncbi:PREDICTED: ras-related protein Rab-9A [Rhinopithecus bieti]|uniref:ras-related protein Rab-9A n=1 Tax=Rhinopithecus bieti TaxID=61621 RepID=UPI00083BA82C|nr:PREDICTED: ras-related protein Rab-9A [Rhinopithecus bieti]